ncbi:MAG: PLP-dependent aminotransferase family protein [Dehalococcoidia bacterium]
MTTGYFDFSELIAERVPPGTTARAGGRPKYDFGTGFPDPDSFPSEGLHEALGRALKEQGRDLVLYPDPQGLPAFREFVVEKLRRERGMIVSPDQVLITGGSGLAIAIYTQLFTNPGDTLLTEQFTYGGTLNIMRNVNANIVGVETDADGMSPSALDETIQDLKRQGKRPKFIYTIPSFQNPLGTDMGVKRRQDILAVATQHGVPIYEDDAYEDLRFEGERSPAIYSYDDSRMVMYSGTFSKILGPGMRLGYMVAPQELMPRINALNWGRPTSQFAVLAAYYYLRDHLDEHVVEVSDILRSRRDTMLGALGEFMGSSAVSSNPPGGMYLWVRLPEGANAAQAAGKARERGVAYLPGTNFSPRGDGENYLRLCYGYENHQGIREGITTLAEVFTKEGMLG